MKLIISTILLFISSTAIAWTTPWALSCADFWGRQVPEAERTPNNCPAHFKKPESRTDLSGNYISGGGHSLPSTVLMPTGNYLIVPDYSTGGISAIINLSR